MLSWLGALGSCAATVLAQGADPALTVQDSEYVGPRLMFQAPDAISESEFSRIMRMLDASEAQRLYLNEFYREYAVSAAALKARHGPTLLALSIQGGKANTPYYSTEGVRAQQALCDEEQQYLDALRQLDHAFIDRIGSVLGPSQIDDVERIRWRRQRDCSGLAACMIPAAKVDLTRLLDALGDEDIWIPAANVSRQYESTITPLFLELDKEFRRTIVPFMAHSMEFQALFLERPADLEARRDGMFDRRKSLFRRQAQLQRRIADVNDRYVHQIAATLPDNAPEEFVGAYQLLAYRVIYPDVLDPTGAVNAVLAGLESDADWVADFRVMERGLNEQRLVVLRRMELAFADWRERFAETMTSGGEPQDHYTARMRAMREELWRINQQIVAELIRAFPAAELSPEIIEYKRVASHVTHKAMTDNFPGG